MLYFTSLKSNVAQLLCNREACKSILSFLSDVFDLPNSSDGGNYREFINTIVLQRGATLTRIMIAAITGALPSGRLEEVCCNIVWCFILLYLKDSGNLQRHELTVSCIIKYFIVN